MCLPVCRHSCFVFGVLVNLLLLALTIYCAHSGKPFAVWVSLLIAFLLAFVFLTCARLIAFGHLRYEPARPDSNSYIVPLNDEEIELYHIGSSPLSTVNEEPSEEEMYRRHLAERPLPPEPAHRRRRSGRGSPFPTLISPLSNPFIEQDTRLPAQNGRNTIRLVPESSRKFDPFIVRVYTLLTTYQVASRITSSEHIRVRDDVHSDRMVCAKRVAPQERPLSLRVIRRRVTLMCLTHFNWTKNAFSCHVYCSSAFSNLCNSPGSRRAKSGSSSSKQCLLFCSLSSSYRLINSFHDQPPYIMFLEDALACLRLPSFSAMGSCCKRMYPLCLCAFIISMLLGTTTWAMINFNTTKALIPLIVATILLSMIEGALGMHLPVFAVIKAINNKPLCESHDPPILLNCAAPSNPAGPLDQALIHPAFRDYNEGSLNSTHDSSHPREGCMDVMSACNAPAIPVPRPYLATGTISRTMSTHRPLPPLPVEPNNAPAPPPHLEEVSEVTILPLRVQKRNSTASDTAVKRTPDDVDVKSAEKPGPKPGDFDMTPGYPFPMSEAEKAITGLASEQDIQEVDQELTDEVKCKPL
ncbi:hypothetical protein KCU69_g77, partial [Aureobasidium melanogenum]